MRFIAKTGSEFIFVSQRPHSHFRRLQLVVLLFGLSSLFPYAQVPDFCPVTDSLLVISQDFQGLKTTAQAVVNRELKNKIGDPFTCRKWEAERERLQDLDIFADIELQAVVKDSQVVLHYSFHELPPYIPFVAVSKTDQDGLSLGPALASLNFLGQGIRAEFITRFGGTTELQASLSSRRLANLPLEYDFAVLHVDSYNTFGGFHEDSWRTKLDLVHQLGHNFNMIYAGEIFQLKTDGQEKSQILLTPKGDWVPRLGGGMVWDSRDRRHDPRHGLFQEVRLTQNGGWLGGPTDFSEWLSDSRCYLSWIHGNILQLAGLYQYRTGEIGQTFGQYDLFHVGGINTLRGFGHDAFKGKSEIIFTAENRMDWVKKRTVRLWKWSAYYGLQGVLGLESASLWDHQAIFERNFHSGAYAGVHLLIAGVDRIRLEAGSKFAKFVFQTDIGIFEKPEIQRFRSR